MTDFSNIALHIEALIFAADKPLPVAEITELTNNSFGFLEQTFSEEQVAGFIMSIETKYSSPEFPFCIKESGGGWQFLTKSSYHKTIAQLNAEKFLKRLSAAAMETLAIVAYKQPVTKGEVEGIRGVNSDYSIQKLLEKEMIVITGRSEDLPGKPLLYATSRGFMNYFGINSVSDLPKIKEVLAEQATKPTIVNEAPENRENEEWLAVNDDGNLVPALNNDNNISKEISNG